MTLQGLQNERNIVDRQIEITEAKLQAIKANADLLAIKVETLQKQCRLNREAYKKLEPKLEELRAKREALTAQISTWTE